MTKQELVKGYQAEIQYQKHMLENLGRWLQLALLLVGIGLVVAYYFQATNLPLFILGLGIAILSVLAMLVIGYGIYRGRLNLQKVIDDFEVQLQK